MGHVRSGARWVHPPNRSPIRQNSPIFDCFCSMGLHFGGMAYAPVCRTGKVACNSLDSISVFEIEPLESCGF